MVMTTLHIIIKGKVQGVFYRDSAKSKQTNSGLQVGSQTLRTATLKSQFQVTIMSWINLYNGVSLAQINQKLKM